MMLMPLKLQILHALLWLLLSVAAYSKTNLKPYASIVTKVASGSLPRDLMAALVAVFFGSHVPCHSVNVPRDLS